MNLAVRQHFREADHFYIDKYLETLTFLEPEIEILQKISNDKGFANDDRIKKRLDYLTSTSYAGHVTNWFFQKGSYNHFLCFKKQSKRSSTL